MTIYHCLQGEWGEETLVYEAKTEQEAWNYLATHGGGLYRNNLHRFTCSVKAGEVFI